MKRGARGVVAELAAQGADALGQRLVGDRNAAPDLVHEAVLRDQPAGLPHEQDERVEIARVELDRRAVAGQPAVGGVEAIGLEAESAGGHLFSKSSAPAHAAHQLLVQNGASIIDGGKAMADLTEIVAGRRWAAWRIVMWGTAAVLLSLPWIAMQLHASGVDWGPRDFVVMGVMLGLAGGACELAALASGSGSFRVAAELAIGAAFLTVWVNLAVGMIGSEANPYNLLFGGVLLLALGGSVAARFRPAGMAKRW